MTMTMIMHNENNECDVDIGPYIEKMCFKFCYNNTSYTNGSNSYNGKSIRDNASQKRSRKHGPPESAFLEAPLLLVHCADDADDLASGYNRSNSNRASAHHGNGGLLNEALLSDVSISDENENENAEFNQVPQEYHRNHEGRLKVLVNHNVLVMFVLAVFAGVVDSLWGGTVFELWVTQWAEGDKYDPYIDYVASASMIITFCLAYPCGFIADQPNRSKVSLIHLGSKILFIGSMIFVVLVVSLSITDSSDESEYTDNNSSDWCFVLFCVILLLGVVGDVTIRGPAQALFADCLQHGMRMQKYCILYCLMIAPKFFGPFTSFMLYDTDGDFWSKTDVRAVMYITAFVALGVCFVMRYFDQSKVPMFEAKDGTVSRSDMGLLHNQSALQTSNIDFNITGEKRYEAHPKLSIVAEPDQESIDVPNCFRCLNYRARTLNETKVAWILLAQNYICGFGGGLFELWWPRLLEEETNLTIKESQLLLLVMPLITSIAIIIMYRVALLKGRAWTMFYGKSFALFMISFAAIITSLSASTSVRRTAIPSIMLYRALMHGLMPIELSVLLDFIHESSRARWIAMYTSVDVIWSGSAILGEGLLNTDVYIAPLLLTTAIQGFALPLLALLFPSIPIHESDVLPEKTMAKQKPLRESVADDVLDQDYLEHLANHILL